MIVPKNWQKPPTTRQLTVTRKPGSLDTACLMLAGKWLADAGFEEGVIVQLTVEENQILIQKTTLTWALEERVITKRIKLNEHGTLPKPTSTRPRRSRMQIVSKS